MDGVDQPVDLGAKRGVGGLERGLVLGAGGIERSEVEAMLAARPSALATTTPMQPIESVIDTPPPTFQRR